MLTLQLDCSMMFACLRDTNNSQSVIEYFDVLERKLGLDTFRKMFPLILTDNGPEFSNPTAIVDLPVSASRLNRSNCRPASSASTSATSGAVRCCGRSCSRRASKRLNPRRFRAAPRWRRSRSRRASKRSARWRFPAAPR